MPWTSKLRSELGIVALTFWGDVSREDIEESNVVVTAMMTENRIAKILTDLADTVSLASSATDIYYLPNTYRALGLRSHFTEAIIAPKAPTIQRRLEFYETVCVNRGNNVRVFSDRNEALRWLLVE